MARQIDFENLSEEDLLYLHDRPWLLVEAKMQGVELPEFEVPKDRYDPQEVSGDSRPAVLTGSMMEESEPEDDEEEVARPYSDWSFAELRDEVARRNDGREGADQLHPDGRSAAALAAALEEDDEESEES